MRQPTKPKTAPTSTLAKGKQKASEAVAKVKEAVTGNDGNERQETEHATQNAAPSNGTETDDQKETEHAAAERASPPEVAANHTEVEPAPEVVESSGIDLETPHLEEQTIR